MSAKAKAARARRKRHWTDFGARDILELETRDACLAGMRFQRPVPFPGIGILKVTFFNSSILIKNLFLQLDGFCFWSKNKR